MTGATLVSYSCHGFAPLCFPAAHPHVHTRAVPDFLLLPLLGLFHAIVPPIGWAQGY